jgi:ABC-type proline/glycine betaine transport system permease subunit
MCWPPPASPKLAVKTSDASSETSEVKTSNLRRFVRTQDFGRFVRSLSWETSSQSQKSKNWLIWVKWQYIAIFLMFWAFRVGDPMSLFIFNYLILVSSWGPPHEMFKTLKKLQYIVISHKLSNFVLSESGLAAHIYRLRTKRPKPWLQTSDETSEVLTSD